MYANEVSRFDLGSFTLELMPKSKAPAGAAKVPGKSPQPAQPAALTPLRGEQRFSYARKYGGAPAKKGGPQ